MFKTPPAANTKISCGQCLNEDTMEMVQCDVCDQWYHFKCAGVNQSVENHKWICAKCENSKSKAKKDERRKSGTMSMKSSRISSQQTKIDLELKQLEEEQALEQALLEKKQALEKQYIKKKYEILSRSEMGSRRSQCSEINQSDKRTSKWVAELPDMKPQDAFDEMEQFISSKKIAARQALSKDLPLFSGKPEEWPVFYSSFEESTKLCGYSNSENLLRLQRALKGKAYDLISSQLLLPYNVPGIIKTLQMMFGRPEIIINSLLDKIRLEPSPKAEKLESLILYAISVKNLCSTLEASGMMNHLKNPLLLQELVNKLPAQQKLSWALQIQENDVDMSHFSKWLFDLAEAATKVSNMCSTNKPSGNVHSHEAEKTAKRESKCSACEKEHSLPECEKFASMKLHDRWNLVKTQKLCRTCLKKHGTFRCSDAKCPVQGCDARHHKLLHKFISNTVTVTTHSSAFNIERESKTYFKIIPVVLYHEGRNIEIFALLDEGSNVTLIDENICKQLGLNGEAESLCLKWTSGTSRVEKDSMKVNLSISGHKDGAKKYNLRNVQTVKTLGLPTQSLNEDVVNYFKHLKHIPFTTYTNAVPSLLIGLNNGYLINTFKMVEGYINEPCASKTRLGWVVHGGGVSPNDAQNVHHINSCDCNKDLETLNQHMSDYFTLEAIEKPYYMKSAEEERACLILQSTTRRVGTHYETGLLWKSDELDIPDSYPMAFKRLQCLEKRIKTEELKFVTEHIKSIVDKGYAQKLTSKELTKSDSVIWYLPVFTVTNPNKPNKIRLVWDAAAKVQGTSLNSLLLKGPDLMAPLLSVLYGFRLYKVAISADIKEMFHQVRIREEDQNAQRFLWRNGESRTPDVYKMEVMTFGAACSPSSAQFVKNKNASEFEDKYPRAVNSIVQHHYVDDLLDGAESDEAAIQLAREVASIHKEAGFFIRNWRSNSEEVLRNLVDLEEHKTSCENLSIDLSTEKVLGMWWSTKTDEFTFTLKLCRLNKNILSGKKRPTKLDVLRILMSIFDPFGFLSPFVVYLKILLQEVWRTTEGWNAEVNDNVFKKWIVWIQLLQKIENVKIPRWYGLNIDSHAQLHIFVDASEQAYAAVGYLRIHSNGEFACKLISSKAKAAPKQPLSIPRMELLAAVQGVRLANLICKMHALQFEKRFFWSDSNTVLSWINSDARDYKQFVMFRIGEILESTESYEWNYVPTKINVADDATKWKGETVFDMNNRWYQGPEFLRNSDTKWPKQPRQHGKSKEELRSHLVMMHVREPVAPNSDIITLERFSSWRKLLKTVFNLFKFGYSLKHIEVSRSTLLFKAENFIYRLIQNDVFKDEISLLQTGKPISKTSILYKCSSYLDANDVLRIHGRIDLAQVKEDTKRPIILPKGHYGTHLIIQHYHEQSHHVQHDTCLNEIRQTFYIPRLRSELKKVRFKCQYCRNRNAVPVVPEMSSLPIARLSSFVRPFSYVGIDYFGPLYVTVGRRKEKRWGVIFTCLTIRAVHIEVSRDLTTDSCIIVIQNFIARRGTPIEIHCDNGTNLRGAETELKRALQELDQKQLEIKFSSSSTTWHFNPPAAPHMGGCWERLIRSVKKILYKISPQFAFRDDTLINALIECERVINSRPLTYVELDSPTDEALTPNHFLLGSSNGQKPLGKFTENDCILRKHWRKLQYFADLFWKRWVNEYLPTLTRRTKWFKTERNLSVDDVVVIVDANLPRNNWPLGIVKNIHKGKDGNVRSADVKTKDGILTRPTAKLAILDVRSSIS